jgi:hypothetical protein
MTQASTTAGTRAVPDDAPEKGESESAYRILRAMLPGMEALAGVTRAELGCIGAYYEDHDTENLIAKMRKLASKESAS